jgi:hypothetical protein
MNSLNTYTVFKPVYLNHCVLPEENMKSRENNVSSSFKSRAEPTDLQSNVLFNISCKPLMTLSEVCFSGSHYRHRKHGL